MPQGLTSKDLVSSHARPRGIQRKSVTPQDKIVSDLYKDAPRYGPSDLLRGMLQADSAKTKTKQFGPTKTNYMDPMSAISMLEKPTRSNDFDVRQFIRDIPYNLGFGTPEDIALNLGPDILGKLAVKGAGLPFLALRRKLLGLAEDTPLHKLAVYRGDKHWWESHDPAQNELSDTLGWMTHAASDPDYATSYANGYMKSNAINWDNDPRTIAQWERTHGKKFRPNIRPIILPESKNVLDLMDPELNDIMEVIGALKNDPDKKWRAERYMQDLKRARQSGSPNDMKNTLRDIADRMRGDLNDPKIFKSTTFDAIRYNDAGYEAYAFPESTLNTATTPTGVKTQAYPAKETHGKPSQPRFVAGPSGEISDTAVPKIAASKPPVQGRFNIGDTVEIQHPGGYTTSHTILDQHDMTQLENYIQNGAQVLSAVSKAKTIPINTPKFTSSKAKSKPGSLFVDLPSAKGMEFKVGDTFDLKWPDGYIQHWANITEHDFKDIEEAIKVGGADLNHPTNINTPFAPASPSGQIPYNPATTYPVASNLDPKIQAALDNPQNYTVDWAGSTKNFKQFIDDVQAGTGGSSGYSAVEGMKTHPDVWKQWLDTLKEIPQTTPTPSIQVPTTANPINVGGGYSGPSIKITNPSDYSWLGPSPNLSYEPTGPAGGSHQGLIARALGSNNPNITDPRFIFKATDERAGLGEQFGSGIANYLNERTPYAPYGDWSGLGTGNLQYMIPNAQNLFNGPITPQSFGNMTPSQVKQLGMEHPIDWLLGNFDAHKGQFLSHKPAFGPREVIPIDKGQAFKHYKSGIFDNPNPTYSGDTPIYPHMRNYLSGLGKVKAREGAIEMVDRIDPSWFMDQMEQYGQKRKDINPFFNTSEFLKIQESKVKSLRPVIENYWK